MEEELSLRDIADILARYRTWLIAFPLVCAAAGLAFGSLGQRSYTSEVVLSISTQGTQGAQTPGILDANLLPGAAAIASGYDNAAPGRLVGSWGTSLREVQKSFASTYNEDNNTVTLSARAGTPQGAQSRAVQAANDFRKYTDGVVSSVISQSYGGRVQQTRLDIQSDRLTLRELRASLASTPQTLPGGGQASGRDALASEGVDRRFAGSSDAPANPAYAYLAVRIAEVEARAASNQAFVERWQKTLSTPNELLTLARQGTQLNTLAQADLPLTPDGPGRLILTLLGALLGVVLAVLGAFVHHALRRPATVRVVGAPQHGD